MRPVSRGIDRIEVTFDEPNLVANAGLLLVATLVARLGLECLINATRKQAKTKLYAESVPTSINLEECYENGVFRLRLTS